MVLMKFFNVIKSILLFQLMDDKRRFLLTVWNLLRERYFGWQHQSSSDKKWQRSEIAAMLLELNNNLLFSYLQLSVCTIDACLTGTGFTNHQFESWIVQILYEAGNSWRSIFNSGWRNVPRVRCQTASWFCENFWQLSIILHALFPCYFAVCWPTQ